MKSWTDGRDEVLEGRSWRRQGPPRDFRTRLTLILLLLPLWFLLAWDPSIIRRLESWRSKTTSRYPSDEPSGFQWDDIEAKEALEFHNCFDVFECAKLKVPLDYFNGTYPDESASIAMVKLPAKVPVTDPRYGGPILINPGGPGGSGVILALAAAANIQTVVDPADDPHAQMSSSSKYFDIIGFDPRGIGQAEPAAYCMRDDPSVWSWQLRKATEGILGSSDAALGRLWSMEHAWGSSCKRVMDAEGGPDIKQYMSTASVARDMLEIVEKHFDYVVERKRETTSGRKSRCRPTGRSKDASEAKLQYWGFSYGTYLGSTFASMYPDRVGRLILDGVVNSDDYDESLGRDGLADTEKAMHSFYTFCILGGPELCALWTSEASAKDIEVRVRAIVQSLYHNPIALDSPNEPEILTYSDIRERIFTSLYSPAALFPTVASLLAEVEVREGPMLDHLAQGLRGTHVYSCSLNHTQPYRSFSVAQTAILCSDGYDKTSETIDSFAQRWHELQDVSPSIGDIWASMRLQCTSWKIRAVHRYEGAFGGNTSHPILFISTTADPVTPLRSAKIMSSRFPGSAVLTQDNAGHCSLSMPTRCTLHHIRHYFQRGILPPPNTLCVPPSSPYSINTTDPDSPFFDLPFARSLFAPDDETFERMQKTGRTHATLKEKHNLLHLNQALDLDRSEDDDAYTMIAAGELQWWMSQNNEFWPSATQARVSALTAPVRDSE